MPLEPRDEFLSEEDLDLKNLSWDELVAYCKQHLAGYKVPKHLVLVDAVVRSPAGKADYRWAVDTAVAAVTGS